MEIIVSWVYTCRPYSQKDCWGNIPMCKYGVWSSVHQMPQIRGKIQHIVKLQVYFTKLFIKQLTMAWYAIITSAESKCKHNWRLFTNNHAWSAYSGRPNRVFGMDTCWPPVKKVCAHLICAKTDDVTSLYEPLYIIVAIIIYFITILFNYLTR